MIWGSLWGAFLTFLAQIPHVAIKYCITKFLQKHRLWTATPLLLSILGLILHSSYFCRGFVMQYLLATCGICAINVRKAPHNDTQITAWIFLFFSFPSFLDGWYFFSKPNNFRQHAENKTTHPYWQRDMMLECALRVA